MKETSGILGVGMGRGDLAECPAWGGSLSGSFLFPSRYPVDGSILVKTGLQPPSWTSL